MQFRLAFITALLLCLSAGTGLADEAAIQRFRAEAPAGWTRLKAGIRQGVSFKRHVSIKNASPSEDFWSHSALGANELAVYYGPDGAPARVDVTNCDYGFVLQCKGRDKPWTLLSLNRDPTSQKQPRGVMPYTVYAFAGCMVQEDWLENLIGSHGFTVKSVEAETSSIYRVSFVSNHKLDKVNVVLGGTLWLDSTRMWAVVKYELKLKSGNLEGTVRCVSDYQDLGGFPFPKETVETYVFPAPYAGEITTEYTEVSRTPKTAEFRLSGFGLPEPIFSQPRRWTWLWVNLAAAAALVVSAYLRHWANKTPPTVAPRE
jgi:hypothetical protein